jgi:hypothetical protein
LDAAKTFVLTFKGKIEAPSEKYAIKPIETDFSEQTIKESQKDDRRRM